MKKYYWVLIIAIVAVAIWLYQARKKQLAKIAEENAARIAYMNQPGYRKNISIRADRSAEVSGNNFKMFDLG